MFNLFPNQRVTDPYRAVWLEEYCHIYFATNSREKIGFFARIPVRLFSFFRLVFLESWYKSTLSHFFVFTVWWNTIIKELYITVLEQCWRTSVHNVVFFKSFSWYEFTVINYQLLYRVSDKFHCLTPILIGNLKFIP